MKKISLLVALTGSLLFITNCGSDKENDGDDLPLTSEQNKELLQSVGIDLTNELAELRETEGVQSLISFGLKLDMEDDEEVEWEARSQRLAGLGNITNNIVAFSYGRLSTIEFGRTAYRVNEDDESLQSIWEDALGTHEWNSETEEFDFTEGGSTVIVRFPSEDGGTSNNATLTLSNYEGVELDSPIEDYSGDLPSSLEVALAVDGTTVMEYSFEIDYSNDGIPEQIDTELILDPFSLTVGLTNTSTKVGASVNLSNGTTTIIEITTDVNGDFTEAAIEAAEDDEDEIDEVISDGSFSLTLLTLKVEATLDFASLYNELSEVETYYDKYYDDGPEPDFEANAVIMEAALAEHTTLSAIYTDTNKKAADIEWYTIINEDEYEIWIGLGARMVFEDGSKIDMEDYLGSGFDELETSLNNLLADLAEDFNEDFDPIDFGDLD